MSDELLPYYNRDCRSSAIWAPSSPRMTPRLPAGRLGEEGVSEDRTPSG